MSWEVAVKARLDGFAGLSALVAARNYFETMPQGTTLPATTFQLVSEFPNHAMSRDAAVKESRIQVSSFALDATTRKDVDAQVRLALSRFRGTSGGTVVQDILEEGATDLFDAEAKEGVYHRARDFRVFWEP